MSSLKLKSWSRGSLLVMKRDGVRGSLSGWEYETRAVIEESEKRVRGWRILTETIGRGFGSTTSEYPSMNLYIPQVALNWKVYGPT